MTPDHSNNMVHWIESILAILDSKDPTSNLMYFLLDFEQEVYNRALVDSMKSVGELKHVDKKQALSTLMALRLSSMPMIKNPPKLRNNVVPLKPVK